MKILPHEKINWVNTLFLILCPAVGIIGTILLCVYSTVSLNTWLLFIIYAVLTGFGITGGYHRLFSHRTYQAPAFTRLIYLLLAAATFQNDVLKWSSDHRIHHRYADSDQDPYNIKRGFWYAHIGWITLEEKNGAHPDHVTDLEADPLCRFQRRFYLPLAVFMGFVLPTLIAWSWGEPLAGFIVAGALRVTLVHHSTFLVNSLCHTLGKQAYDTTQTARDHWLSAILTLGEGYHNFHHKFPIDYRNGIKFYHADPTKWLIWTLSKIGLAHNLKRAKQDRIDQLGTGR